MRLISDAIGETDIAGFERAGAICLRGLFDENWIARMRKAVDRRVERFQARFTLFVHRAFYVAR